MPDQRLKASMKRLDEILTAAPAPEDVSAVLPSALDRNAPTAVISVAAFSGFGLHQILSIHRSFPHFFKQFIFVSAAVVDSGTFKGAVEIERLVESTELNLKKYVAWAQKQGWTRADIQEGEKGNGLEFLAMHRAMMNLRNWQEGEGH